MSATMLWIRPLLISSLILLAGLPAVAQEAPATDCEAFRLDWVTGGPLNPEPGASSSSDKAVCAGVEDRAACLLRHKGDGKQHDYVIAHDQGANGNCTFQAVAGVLNFEKSAGGGKPDVSPEYLAAQDCDNFLPGQSLHNTSRAISSFNKNGSCTREDLAQVTNGGELSETLEKSYFSSAILSVFGGSLPNINKDSKADICSTLSSKDTSPGTLALAVELGAITDKIGAEKNVSDAMGARLDVEKRIRADTAAPSGTAEQKQSAKDRAKQRANEYGRCKADQDFFKYLCADKVQKPGAPHLEKKEKVPADNFKSAADLKELANACASKFSKPLPKTVTENNLVAAMKGNAEASDCVQAYMKSRLLSESVGNIEKNGKPLIIAVSDATGLMGKSGKRSDVGHAMVLIGREKRAGQCGYWVRNSWGSSCPMGDSGKILCDPDRPGNVWISAASLSSSAGVQSIYNVSP